MIRFILPIVLLLPVVFGCDRKSSTVDHQSGSSEHFFSPEETFGPYCETCSCEGGLELTSGAAKDAAAVFQLADDPKPEWCKLPPNPGKDCMGYIMYQDVVSGTKLCDPLPTATEVADQIWAAYKDGKKIEICAGVSFADISSVLAKKYVSCALKDPKLKDGGFCYGTPLDFTKLEEGDCASIAIKGERTYKDGTKGPILHAVMLCKQNGKAVVYDNNDPTAGAIPATVNGNTVTWTANYNKPPKPVGAATQTGDFCGAREIIKKIDM